MTLQISIQRLILIILIVFIVSAALTEYYFPRVNTKTVTVDHEVIKNNIVTVVKTVKLPNGETDTTSTTTDNSIKAVTDSTDKTVVAQPKLNVSALVANDFSRGLLVPTYGVSVSKQVLGPFTVGGFGLTNGTIGLSIGVNF